MKDQIQKLKEEKTQLSGRIAKLDTAINALQDVCSHKHEDGADAMKSQGHDSHKEYFECTICGWEDYV